MDVRDVSRRVDGGVEIDVIVSPNSAIRGTDGTDGWRRCLSLRVRSPPADGKANKEVEELIRNITGCASEIIRGRTDRRKVVMIHGDPEMILSSLEAAV